jgi:predicted ATPase
VFTRLEFRDFRGFAHLDLQGLQRVNLICGQNNSGKTSLLEGIEVLCDPGSLRGGLSLRPDTKGSLARRVAWWMRDGARQAAAVIGWSGEEARRTLVLGSPSRGVLLPSTTSVVNRVEGLEFFVESHRVGTVACRVVAAHHQESSQVIALFDKAVSRREGEERIEHLLRIVDPRVRKVRARTPPGEEAFLEVDLGLSERIPLAHTGQGLIRLVAIFSLMIGEAPQVCVIDEIENGLHHTLLPQIWTGIAAAAREFDVQVFATTHSRECIEAAHEVFTGQASYDFSVIQLFRSDSNRDLPVQGRVLDQRLVSAAMSGSVDLR